MAVAGQEEFWCLEPLLGTPLLLGPSLKALVSLEDCRALQAAWASLFALCQCSSLSGIFGSCLSVAGHIKEPCNAPKNRRFSGNRL